MLCYNAKALYVTIPGHTFSSFKATFNSNCERNPMFKQFPPVHKDLKSNQQLIADIEETYTQEKQQI